MCFALLSFMFFSCAIMPAKEDRIARNNDFFNRFSRIELMVTRVGKFGDEYIKLRKNKTFVYRTEFMGIKNTYCSGTYTYEDDVLRLTFDSNSGFSEANSVFTLTENNGRPYFKNAAGWEGVVEEYSLLGQFFPLAQN